jgi:hypothetical protein
MKDIPTIIDFVTDPQLLCLSVSPAQQTLLKAIYGLHLTSAEHDLWMQCTNRSSYPGRSFREATVLAGARGGKDSRIATPVVSYEAVFGDHARYLGKGEFGILPLVAQDHRATRIAFSYLKDAFTRSSLKPMRTEFGFHYKEQRLLQALTKEAKHLDGWLLVAEQLGLGRYVVCDQLVTSAIQEVLGVESDKFQQAFDDAMGQVFDLAGALCQVVNEFLGWLFHQREGAIISRDMGTITNPLQGELTEERKAAP